MSDIPTLNREEIACDPPEDPEPVMLADGVEVKDARFNAIYNGPPSIIIVVNRRPECSDSYPVPASEEGETWVTQTSGGRIYAFHDGPIQPPANTSPRTKTYPVEHESKGVEQRVKHFSHSQAYTYNKRDDLAGKATPAYIRTEDEVTTGRCDVPVRVETVAEIIATYINGPLGGETNFDWKYRARHDDCIRDRWQDKPDGMDRNDVSQLDNANVSLECRDDNHKPAVPQFDVDVGV